MKKVRVITWIGLVISVSALMFIPYYSVVAFTLGALGFAVSCYALATSKE